MQPTDCAACVTLIGRPLITSFAWFGCYVSVRGLVGDAGDVEARWRLRAAAAKVGVTYGTVKKTLCLKAALFEPPYYRARHRLLSRADVETLERLFPPVVKQ